MKSTLHPLLLGIGDLFNLMPEEEKTVTHPRLRRFTTPVASVQQAFATDRLAMAKDLQATGQDMWKALRRFSTTDK
ncbi:MAG: hypothetical protein G8345_15425 [Magnetococcales bacterium]|nr:hypothetical protein [Magnetococcales bacterium]NGZ28268.1 hypothetical protein [Magnetococcales bacterium]